MSQTSLSSDAMRPMLTFSLVFAVSACAGAPNGAGGESEAVATVCPGWIGHEAPGGTSFALPGRTRPEMLGAATSFAHSETEVYFELREGVVVGSRGGSDAAAAEGILAGLGEVTNARLDEGWRIIEQRMTEFEGRPAVERVIDISGQIRRRELYLRAGETMVSVITMTRNDRADSSADAVRCFHRSLRFAAPRSD